MERIAISPRQNWAKEIEALGFDFYKTEGTPYWYESAYYRFCARQVDQIEAAANSLHDLYLQAVDHVVSHRLYPLMGISPAAGKLIEESWRRKDPTIYGRFDLMYDGEGPPKLLEYNADTPTSLFEASIVQWQWREQTFPRDDQFNSIHEGLVARWQSLLVGQRGPNRLHVTCITPMPEDEATVGYMGATAVEAGHEVKFLPIQDIGWDMESAIFRDMEDKHIQNLFKLYPWEWLLNEEFGDNIGPSRTRMIEPAWKMLLANKHMLTILWELFPGHENLLASYSAPDASLGSTYVRKPVLGREGSNVQIIRDGSLIASSDGPYADGDYIYQEYAPPPCFQGSFYPNLGVWMINGTCHGMGIREDDSLIIGNMSRFVPHVFSPA